MKSESVGQLELIPAPVTTLAKRCVAVEVMGQYTVKLQSVGNPDYGQYTAISEPEMLFCDTLKQCVEGAMRYREEWNLGGGNWHAIFVVKNGRKVAEISYNGRLWEPVPYCKGRKEIFA